MKYTYVARPLSLKAELKDVIYSQSASTAANGFLLSPLCGSIVAGTAQANRVGNRIRVKSVEVIGQFGVTASGSAGIPLTATLLNNKTTPTSLDYTGPFVSVDNADIWGYTIQDFAGQNTFKFRKSFGPTGRELRFEKDLASTVIGDFNPAIFVQNPNGIALSSPTQIWVRVRYYDA